MSASPSNRGERSGSGLVWVSIAAFNVRKPISSMGGASVAGARANAKEWGRGQVKSTRVAESRHRKAARQDRQHLEQIPHLVGAGETLDVGGDFLARRPVRSLSKPAGTTEQSHAEQEFCLRRHVGFEAMRACNRGEGGEIDMGGEISLARIVEHAF